MAENNEIEESHLFMGTEVTTWPCLKEIFSKLHAGWIFRGQSNAQWPIRTTVERLVRGERRSAEIFLLQEIEKHKYNLNLKKIPEIDFEKLVLLQHYGAPTRLVDFTYSPYVATFFALKSSEDSSAIYAIDTGRLNITLAGTVADIPDSYKKTQKSVSSMYNCDLHNPDAFRDIVTNHNGNGFVAHIDPLHHNERTIAQSSTFLTIGDINKSFLQNLGATLKASNLKLFRGELTRKYVLSNRIRTDALDDLRRMNISEATLFPGIDGFVRSLYPNLDAMLNKITADMNVSQGVSPRGLREVPRQRNLQTTRKICDTN